MNIEMGDWTLVPGRRYTYNVPKLVYYNGSHKFMTTIVYIDLAV